MSKTTEHMVQEQQVTPEHTSAVSLIKRFMEVCRDVHMSPRQFENHMKTIYYDAKKHGF